MQNSEVTDLACVNSEIARPLEMTLPSLRPVNIGCCAVQQQSLWTCFYCHQDQLLMLLIQHAQIPAIHIGISVVLS